MNNHKNKCFTEGLQLREPKFAKIRQILPKNCRKTFDWTKLQYTQHEIVLEWKFFSWHVEKYN